MKRVICARSSICSDGVHSGISEGASGTRVFSPFVDISELRAEFPALRRLAYFNAGTDGPLSARAVAAAVAELQREADDGRSGTHFERMFELRRQLRRAYAGLLDGAQGVGAIPIDVTALGCDAYAGAGQKWLCGPDGTGMLYVSPKLRAQIDISRRGFGNLAEPNAGLDAGLHEDARRLDCFS